MRWYKLPCGPMLPSIKKCPGKYKGRHVRLLVGVEHEKRLLWFAVGMVTDEISGRVVIQGGGTSGVAQVARVIHWRQAGVQIEIA